MSNALEKAAVFQSVNSLHNAAVTSTSNSLGVDITDYTGIVEVSITASVVTGTNPTLDVTVQSSDASGSGYASVNKTDGTTASFTQMTAATTIQRVYIDTAASKRFVRLAFTAGGTTPSFAVNANLRGVKKIV